MSDFKGRHFGGEIVLWAVRWYCRYPISYRDLETMMTERGVAVDHSTIYEIDALGDLATEDPLSLAAGRYVQLRRFAPAFLEAFEFDAPAAGRCLHAAVELLRELNRSGRRNLPDIVPIVLLQTCRRGESSQARKHFRLMFVRWPDGPVAMP